MPCLIYFVVFVDASSKNLRDFEQRSPSRFNQIYAQLLSVYSYQLYVSARNIHGQFMEIKRDAFDMSSVPYMYVYSSDRVASKSAGVGQRESIKTS